MRNILIWIAFSVLVTICRSRTDFSLGQEPFLPTPWSSDPSAPRLYMFTYSSKVSLQECSMYHAAHVRGYRLNIFGVWERLAFGVFKKRHVLDSKLMPTFAALRRLKEDDPKAIAVLFDAADVVFQLRPEDLMARFLAMGATEIVGAEANCAPVSDACRDAPWAPPAVQARVHTIWPNSGFIIGRVGRLYDIWQGCYWKKVDGLLRGSGVPDYVESDDPAILGNDQSHMYYAMRDCGLASPPQLDYFQDLVANLYLREDRYSYDTEYKFWTQIKGGANDTAAHSELAARQLLSGTPEVAARAPVAIHLNGPVKLNSWSKWMKDATEDLFTLPGGSKEEFLASEVNWVGLRMGRLGEICYPYPSGYRYDPDDKEPLPVGVGDRTKRDLR